MKPSRWWWPALALLAACGAAERPATNEDVAATGDVVRFVARVNVETERPVPANSRLVAYVVESDLDLASKRVIAETSQAAGTFPAEVTLDIARDRIDLARGYEMLAAVLDSEDRVLLAMPGNRPPQPALSLDEESVFDIVLRPTFTPAQDGQVFRIPTAVELACGEQRLTAEQRADGALDVRLEGSELTLSPAVASAGGRFSDGSNELWVTPGGEWIFLQRGGSPRTCREAGR